MYTNNKPARNLKIFRVLVDMTQEELGNEFGMSKANISAIESGKNPITIGTASKLLKFAIIKGHKLNMEFFLTKKLCDQILTLSKAIKK